MAILEGELGKQLFKAKGQKGSSFPFTSGNLGQGFCRTGHINSILSPLNVPQMLNFILPPHTLDPYWVGYRLVMHIRPLAWGSQTTKTPFLSNYLTKTLVLLVTMKVPENPSQFLSFRPSSTFPILPPISGHREDTL